MKYFFHLISFLIFIFENSYSIIPLDNINYDQIIETNKFVFINIYAKWCHHCKNTNKEIYKVYLECKIKCPEIKFAEIDAVQQKELIERFNVDGYPSLKFLINKTIFEYTGGKTSKEIMEWLIIKSGNTSINISKKDELQYYIENNELIIVFFGKPNLKFNAFDKASKIIDNEIFLYTFDLDLIRIYLKNMQDEGIMIFKKNEIEKNYNGDLSDFAEIIFFINENRYSIVSEFNKKIASKVFIENNKCLFLFVNQSLNHNYAINALMKASNELKEKIIMTIARYPNELSKKLGNLLGLKEENFPLVRIVAPNEKEIHEMKKYALEKNITYENLLNFVDDFNIGMISPYYKSQEEVVDQNKTNILKILVGKNFKTIVFDESYDTLVLFYAEWCKFSQEALKIFKEIAERFNQQQYIYFGIIEGTKNEIAGIQLDKFPKIKFFLRNRKKDPFDFKGKISENEILKFIFQYSTVSLELSEIVKNKMKIDL